MLINRHDEAIEYAANYVNGNRESTCLVILTRPNPAVMASMVALLLSRNDKWAVAEEFITILDSVIENTPKVVVANKIDTVNM